MTRIQVAGDGAVSRLLTRVMVGGVLLVATSVHAQTTIGTMPDPTLTPGAVRTTNIGEICSTGTRELRHWSRERDTKILAEYGLPNVAGHIGYEIDHLIPLSIGGSDADANLWPQPRRSIEPVWNAETKDDLEWKLRDLVCGGALDVRTAQRAISEDWTAAYRKYVGVPINDASAAKE